MAKRKPFYVYKRQKKHGSYWYVCYINPDTGEQENARSIDVLKEKLEALMCLRKNSQWVPAILSPTVMLLL